MGGSWGPVAQRRAAGSRRRRSLLDGACVIIVSGLSGARISRRSVLRRNAVRGFRTLHAVGKLRLLPARPRVQVTLRRARSRLRRLVLGRPASANRMNRGARGSSDPDAVGVVLQATLDAVSWWKEGIESLNKIGMTGEKLRNATNDTRSVDAASS